MWDGLKLLEERDAAGNLVARYSHGYTPIAGIGSVVEAQRVIGGATYYQYPVMDHRGTVYAVTDASQNTLLSYTLDAFGRQLSAIGGSQPDAPNDLIYQSNWLTVKIGGKWWGLSPSRLYEFETGRFTQRDPLPSLIKVVTAAEGNALGLSDGVLFAREISWNMGRETLLLRSSARENPPGTPSASTVLV